MRRAALLALIFAGSTMLQAQAVLSVPRNGGLICPSSASTVQFFLSNNSGATETLPAGTTIAITYSAPIVRGPFSAGATFTVSAATATGTFSNTVTIPTNTSLGFTADLNTQSLAIGAPVSVTFTITPSSAAILQGQGSGTIVGLADQAACRAPLVPVVTVDDILNTCPTAKEVSDFNAALKITFQGDPTGPALVCKAADGSANLTRLQERLYQALRIMRAMPLDTPLPWTTKTLYDWLVGNIKGIIFNPNTQNSFCCIPDGMINIQTQNLVIEQYNTADAMFGFIALVVHESRHNEGALHTCGSLDQTLSELGAWAAEYYFEEWAMQRTGGFFNPGGTAVFSTNEQASYWTQVNQLLGEICDLGSGVVATPATLSFTTTLPKAIAITQTKGPAATISAVSITGANATDFTIASNTCIGAILPPSCVVTVGFSPAAAGVRNAALTYTFGSTTQSVALSGGSVAGGCEYQLPVSGVLVLPAGGSGSVAVTASKGCTATAVSNAPWITMNGLAYRVDANPGGQARLGTITAGGATFGVTQAGYAPQVIANGVTNGASFVQGAAPGGIVSIFGNRLTHGASGVTQATTLPLPKTLAGTSVTIGGISAPLFAVVGDPNSQVNIQIPFELAGQGTANMVASNGAASVPVAITISATQPGVFTSDGTTAVVLHGADNSPVTPAHPASRGETVVIFATGLGVVSPAVATGTAAPITEPLARTPFIPSVLFGGTFSTIQYSGLAPGYVGLYQVNATISTTAPKGNQTLTVNMSGNISPVVMIPIN